MLNAQPSTRARRRLAKTVGNPMRPARQGHAPDARYVHIIAKNRAEAVKRDLIRQAMTRDGKPLPAAPPPATPLINTDEAEAARIIQEMDAIRARQKANALAFFAEEDARQARWKGSIPAPIPCAGERTAPPPPPKQPQERARLNATSRWFCH